MDKNDIIDYVMHTPHNTNKAVLSSMLNQLTEGGGGGTSWTTLTEESVTTTIVEDSLFAGSDDLIYSERITADIIKVTFNGTEYTCNKRIDNGDSFYGAEWSYATDSYDFSQYPFEITSLSDANFLYTETAGTYQVKIEAPQSGGSSDFSTAQVTVDLQSNKFYFMLPFADDTSGSSLCRIAQSGTYKAILYTDMSVGIVAPSGGGVPTAPTITVTGDAEQIDLSAVRVTGDCTITIG